MRTIKFFLIIIFLILPQQNLFCQAFLDSDVREVVIEWLKGEPKGTVEILNGSLSELKILKGKGKTDNKSFRLTSKDEAAIVISLSNTVTTPGSGATVISVNTDHDPFSFFLRDVSKAYPIYIPEYFVVVKEQNDDRSYLQIEREIKSRDLSLKLQHIGSEPEESFEHASAYTRHMSCPTWLGISRDIRIFEISNSLNDNPQDMEVIKPRMSGYPGKIPELNIDNISYKYLAGRGQGVTIPVSRNLEQGILPILHTTLMDEGIKYSSTTFVSLELSSLNDSTSIGTDFLVADYFSYGHMFTSDQEKMLEQRMPEEMNKTEATVLYCKVEALNTSSVPGYVWFKTICPQKNITYNFNEETGFSSFSEELIFGISLLNGKPLMNEEISVLLKPDEKAVFEFRLPHSPVSKERALSLLNQSFESRYIECRNFWESKLDKAAQIQVPEKRINEMLKAGLLHLDLITYGKEPTGTLAPCIGVYSPIGTESAPIIQFYNSMGLHDIAERSAMYFLDKQHEDGFIQNFGGYMVETGAALWTMGEYYRYTHDVEWVRQNESKLLKSVEYLLNWRNQNKRQDLIGKGYGMIEGKVADPVDPYHQFMLNGYAYLGISRVAEMLATIDPETSEKIKKEAEAWKQDIRTSFFKAMANSPVVPLGDGTWCPTVPPWPENKGLRGLFIDPVTYFSHGTFTTSDLLLGPLYLVFCEVLDPEEQAAKMMLNYSTEIFLLENAAFSQPYYSRHNWIQLKLGLVKPFLKTYYYTFSALADRETYTFWEHLYHMSPHKTHEEAWFLMQTRWMLYMEEGQTLNLLKGIPRRWLEDGKKIELRNVASYFGPVSLDVHSNVKSEYIDATVECLSERKPQQLVLRLPHPEGKKPRKVSEGVFNNENETLTINSFTGKVNIRIEY